MRRALLFVSLIFALVLSPIGAMAHAYQHFDRAEDDPFHAKHEAGAPCGLCAAFVALEHAAAGSKALPIVVGDAVPPLAEGTRGIAVRPFQHFFQRAPPTLL